MKEYKYKLSVIMSVFNGEKYLEEAIDSILNQTLKDFEFIIIDDGSTDRTCEIIKSYKDNRIKVIKNEVNLRLPKSLNKGIDIAQGEYIARMDANDICLKERFQKQVDYMDNHKDVGLCGTNMRLINEDNVVLVESAWPPVSVPLEWTLLWENPIGHISAMMRKSVLDKFNFRYKDIYAEDGDLWCRMALHTRIARIDEVLTTVLIQKVSESSTNRIKHMRQAIKSSIEYAKNISRIEPPDFHKNFLIYAEVLKENNVSMLDSSQITDWFLLLRKKIIKKNGYSDTEDEEIIKDILIRTSVQYKNEINKLKEEIATLRNKDEVIIANLVEEVRARKNDIVTIKNSKIYKVADKMGKIYRKVRYK